MSSQSVSRGFHRLGVLLFAITLLVGVGLTLYIVQAQARYNIERLEADDLQNVISGLRAAASPVPREQDTTLTGADFLEACTKNDFEWIGFCNGYMQAAFDATGGKGICAPKGITRDELSDIIIPKLMKALELHELNATSVVYAILRQAFPYS